MFAVLIVLAMVSVVVGATALVDLDTAKADHATKITKINAELAVAIAKAKIDRQLADIELVVTYDSAIAKSRDPAEKTRLSQERDSLEGLKCILIPKIKRIAKVKGPLKSGMQLGPFRGKKNRPNDEEVLRFIRMRSSGQVKEQTPHAAQFQGNAAGSCSFFWFYLKSPRDMEVGLKVGGSRHLSVWLGNDLVSSDGKVALKEGWNLLIVRIGSVQKYGVTVELESPGPVGYAVF